MGSVFLIPWTWLDGSPYELRKLGFRTVAMALTEKSISIDNPILATEPKLAIVMGTEGDGLQNETINEADYVVRIPMANGVDSLNVAAASAIAFWQLRCQNDHRSATITWDVYIYDFTYIPTHTYNTYLLPQEQRGNNFSINSLRKELIQFFMHDVI